MRDKPEPFDITVLIPVFGRQDDLNVALKSIASQSRKPEQVIVVDDCSPVPIEIPPALGDSLSISVVRLLKNCGGSAAINSVLDRVQTNLVAILDSDDAYHPEYIETVIKKWSQLGQGVALLATSFFWCTEKLIPYRAHRGPTRKVTISYLLGNGNLIGGKSVFSARTDVLVELGGLVQSRGAEDWLLVNRILEHYEIEVLAMPLVYYRGPNSNSGSMSRNYRRQAVALNRVYRPYRHQQDQHQKDMHALLLMKALLRGGRRRMALRVMPRRWPGLENTMLMLAGSTFTHKFYGVVNRFRAVTGKKYPKLLL